MNRDAVLAAFTTQVRQRPPATDGRIERDGAVVRCMSGTGWTGVTWCDTAAVTADAVIAAQVSRFCAQGRPWEWKHYGGDRPPDLPRRLLAAGFTPGPAEALMVAEIGELAIDVAPPPGLELRETRDVAGITALVSVHDRVFGGDHSGMGTALLASLRRRPPGAAAVVAFAGHTPVCAGRVEFGHGTEFASLWGGGTVPGWRGRGLYRATVAWRATRAAAAGFRYLQVDALPASRPILERLGFAVLATTTPFTHPGAT